LKAILNLGYLDNVTLGETVNTVVSDVAKIIRAGTEIGLSLNACLSHLGVSLLLTKIFMLMMHCYNQFQFEDASLLGAPASWCSTPHSVGWSVRGSRRAVDRLRAFEDALILLRSLFSAHKIFRLL